MFWRAGVTAPPNSVGKTAVAAFSSGNFFLGDWLKDDTKRKGHFLSSVVSAIYFLDPMRSYVLNGKSVPVLDEFVASALKWAAEGTDKRIRLYMQFLQLMRRSAARTGGDRTRAVVMGSA